MGAIIGDGDVATISKERLREEEPYILEQINLPGEPEHERRGRTAWLQIPLRTRVAIKRLRRQFGHVPNRAFVQLLRISRMSSDYIEADKNYIRNR
eukprot:1636190-Pyramimonas_sp.AAC.1